LAQFKLVIFDLDDVLFSENDYVKSGFRSVAKILSSNKITQKKLYREMIKLFKKDSKHVFDNLIKSKYLNLDVDSDMVNLMIETYHNHLPDIHPYQRVLSLLKKLRNEKISLAILSDGSEHTQKLKIKSLGIQNHVDKIILTDSLGTRKKFWKPSTYGFKLLLDHFKIKANNACYVGDNMSKDFLGPVKLGIIPILFKNKDGLYYVENPSEKKAKNTIQYKFTVSSIQELENLLLNQL